MRIALFLQNITAVPTREIDFTASSINALIFLIALALLATFATRFLRNRRVGKVDSGMSEQLQVISSKALSARSRLVTARFNNQILLLGVTESSITTLASHSEEISSKISVVEASNE